HQTDGNARAAEYGFDDFAVRVVRDDDPVLDRVTADDAAGGHFQVEDRIIRRRKLVDELLGGCATVPNPGVAFFQDDHATAFEAGIIRIHGGGNDVGEAHVGDEAPPLVHLQHGFLSILPFGHAHLAGEHAGFNADEGDGFGEREGGADLFALLTRLG